MKSPFRVGVPTIIEARAPHGPFAVVFEDDGGTGYVYGARRRRLRQRQVLDALHLYNVDAVKDRALGQTLEHCAEAGLAFNTWVRGLR